MDHLGAADDVIALDHAGQVALEVEAHLRRVRPGPAQEGRRLKGAAAGAHACCAARKRGKRAQIVIDLEGNNARPLVRKLAGLPEYEDVFVSGRLPPQQVAGLHQVLEQLRHQL